DAEAGVAPNLLVHDARWLLGGEYQVNSQAASHANRGDQLLHEVGHFGALRKLRELVNDDYEMRQRLGDLSLPVTLLVPVDMVLANLGKEGLAALQLTFESGEDAHYQPAFQVGYRTYKVGEILKGVGHAAAL